METLIAIAMFVIGMILGSFVNVCIYRLPRKQSIIWPPSSCPRCGNRIRPCDNIPLISYLLLRGKCRHCKLPIHWRYPVVELTTGLLSVGLYFKFGLTSQLLSLSVLTLLLITISFIDLEFKLILNKLTLLGLVLGSVLSLLLNNFTVKNVLLGFVVGGGVLFLVAILGNLVFRKESMGMGDIKMAAMIGVFLGAKGVGVSLFFAFVFAALICGVGMLSKRLQMQSYVPFGPFIALGTIFYLFAGETIVTWYLQRLNF